MQSSGYARNPVPHDTIDIRGAREHNLKNIDLSLPRDSLIVLTGLSGSGKSSLAFDTIYAEGQRRYVESLSAYARQFLGQMEKPDVDHIDGLSPAISIDQKGTSKNPRSTVGTVTEIYDYLRLVYARIGHPHCPRCGREISKQTIEQIADQVLALPDATRLMVAAPMVQGRKGEHRDVFTEARRKGYARARVDGVVRDLGETIALDKKFKHDIEIVVDRVVIGPELRSRLTNSLEQAAKLSDGLILLIPADEPAGGGEERISATLPTGAPLPDGQPAGAAGPADADGAEPAQEGDPATGTGDADGTSPRRLAAGEMLFSQDYACVYCGISMEEPAPRNFSFNNPHGACPTCTGLGLRMEVDRDAVVRDPSLSIDDGALSGWTKGPSQMWVLDVLQTVCRRYRIPTDVPFGELPAPRAAGHPLRAAQGRDGPDALRLPHRAHPLLRGRLRGGDPQPRAPLPRDRVGVGQAGDRAADDAEAVPRLRRQAAQAGVPRRHRRRDEHHGLHRPHRGGGAAPHRDAPPQRPRDGDRRPGVQGDPRTARLPPRRRPRLPQPRPRLGQPLRWREPAHQAGHPDRKQADGRPLHPRRAVHRSPSAGQSQAARHPHHPPRPRQHPDRGRARRGDDPQRGLHRRHRPGGRARRAGR